MAGAARRSYEFPAPLPAAFRFNTDLDGMLALLPHISVIAAPAATTRRLCYHSTEAGLYRVRIYCTIAAEVDAAAHRLRIRPLDDAEPQRAGFRSMSGHGRYESTIAFHPLGDATRIEYALKISAQVPTPGSLRLIPASLADARATRRLCARLDEIVEGFVRRSIAAYRAAAARRAPGSRTARASRAPRA